MQLLNSDSSCSCCNDAIESLSETMAALVDVENQEKLFVELECLTQMV